MKILISAANLRNGGAVTVASALLDAIIGVSCNHGFDWISHLSIDVSQQVALNMRINVSEVCSPEIDLRVKDVQILRQWVRPHNDWHDVRLTIFGPEYGPRKAKFEVVGFADGSLIPVEETPIQSSAGLSVGSPLKKKIKLLAMRRYDAYVVQTEDMALALARHVQQPITVIPNVPAPIFNHSHRQTDSGLPIRRPGEIRLFYPARGYPHKNHKALESICDQFMTAYRVPLSIVTTLRAHEMRHLDLASSVNIINVGEVSTQRCASLYSNTDGLIFPSLNETASSAPLEAMAMGKPVFASDLPNIRKMTNNMGIYFDPFEPKSAAMAIHQLIDHPEEISLIVLAAQEWIRGIGTIEDQAWMYLNMLRTFQSKN